MDIWSEWDQAQHSMPAATGTDPEMASRVLPLLCGPQKSPSRDVVSGAVYSSLDGSHLHTGREGRMLYVLRFCTETELIGHRHEEIYYRIGSPTSRTVCHL